MASHESIDCELYVSDFDHAKLRVAGQDYSGKPTLDDNLRNNLRQATLNADDYGNLLFGALFPANDDLLAGYRNGLAIARHERLPLRFRLFIDSKAPAEIHALSWELLRDSERRLTFSRSGEIAFSRYAGLGVEAPPALEAKPRLLVVISSPSDLSEHGLAEIERNNSADLLAKALSPLSAIIDYEVLEGKATPTRIRQKLADGGFHALHIEAHGVLQSGRRDSSIVLEKDDGTSNFVSANLFSEVFKDNSDLRLITLIACYGGAQTGDDPFGGLGPELVREGFPAVIAMQQSISIEGAAHFCEYFYKKLAQSGLVDVSVNEARQLLFLENNPPTREWARPMLFMRLTDARIWTNTSPAAQQAAAVVVAHDDDSNIDWASIKLWMPQGSVVPIIGPELNRGLLLSNDEIAERLAREVHYRVSSRDDLPRVAKYVETMTNVNFPHGKMLEILKSDLLEREKIEAKRELKAKALPDVIESISQAHFNRDKDNPHRILAQLPITTYITTNADNFMTAALKWKNRTPVRQSCLWRASDPTYSDPASPYQCLKGDSTNPLVFHLFGSDEKVKSLVVTEDDYLDFLRFVSLDQWRIPRSLKATLTEAMLLFLGYDIRDLDFRVLFKSLVEPLQEGLGRIAVLQMDPEDSYSQKLDDLRELQKFVKKDASNLKIQIYWGSVRSFLISLRDHLEE